MNQELIMWLLGGLAGYVVLISFAAIKAWLRMTERVTKVETLLYLISAKAAKALHSPTNHHGIDPILDEYMLIIGKLSNEYRGRFFELPWDKWEAMKKHMELIEDSEDTSPLEKLLAGMISATCEHKLMKPRNQEYESTFRIL